MNNEILSLVITILYVAIITLLVIIRKYQKEISKIKTEQRLIRKHIKLNSNENELQELQTKYDILMKILDNVQVEKGEKKDNGEKVS